MLPSIPLEERISLFTFDAHQRSAPDLVQVQHLVSICIEDRLSLA